MRYSDATSNSACWRWSWGGLEHRSQQTVVVPAHDIPLLTVWACSRPDLLKSAGYATQLVGAILLAENEVATYLAVDGLLLCFGYEFGTKFGTMYTRTMHLVWFSCSHLASIFLAGATTCTMLKTGTYTNSTGVFHGCVYYTMSMCALYISCCKLSLRILQWHAPILTLVLHRNVCNYQHFRQQPSSTGGYQHWSLCRRGSWRFCFSLLAHLYNLENQTRWMLLQGKLGYSSDDRWISDFWMLMLDSNSITIRNRSFLFPLHSKTDMVGILVSFKFRPG